MRIHISSLGCKLNQSEVDALSVQLTRSGHEVVASPAEADLCVLNTCTVTHVAAQKSRQALRRLHRENPHARLLATGCYAELTPGDLRNLPGVEFVIGNEEKEHLAELIDGLIEARVTAVGRATEPAAGGLGSPPSPALPRSRALVKIQDGCDNACTYCIIHVARGSQRSRSAAEVLANVRSRLAQGHQEIVLTGVHIGAYGHDHHGDGDLWALVTRILAETAAPRLRLSSIEPWDLPETAFPLWGDPRLCRHLHLPLQSGCDATLQRMARRYDTAEFAELVESARAAIPDLAITTDVIVGFPGETQADFGQSLDFVEAMGFSRVHVFPYSIRPGTPAASMPDQVPPPLKAERARSMRAVAASSNQAFRQKFTGRTMDVLWESVRTSEAGPLWRGLTDNYLRIQVASPANLANMITPTRLVALTEGGLQGKLET
jgi:threonylcarbamoyladenosine tRNA methylthiotransferase MtaB